MRPKTRGLYLFTWILEFSVMLVVFGVSRALAEAGEQLWVLGVVGGGFSLFLSVSSAVSGRWSDRANRPRVMATGTLLLALCVGGCILTGPGHKLYYLSYWLSGAAIGLIYPPLYAQLSAGADRNGFSRGIGRTIIGFAMMWNLGLISGLTAGGWLFKGSADWPLYGSIALAGAALYLLRIISPAAAAQAQPPLTAPSTPDANPQILSAAFMKLAWLANLGSAFSMGMVIHLFPDLAVQLGVPSDRHGNIVATSRVVVILTYFAMYSFSFWHLRFAPAVASQALAAVGLIVISYAQQPVELVVGLALLSQLAGFNYFASLFYSTAGSSHERRGAASGFHEATLAMGFAAGSILGGLAGGTGDPGTPYRLGAVVIVVLALVQTGVYVTRVRPLMERSEKLQQSL
jgi:MFS family permease